MYFRYTIKIICYFTAFFILIGTSAFASNNNFILQNVQTDSINNYDIFNDWMEIDSIYYFPSDTLPINPLFMPVVFNGKVLPDNLKLYTPAELWKKPAYIPEQKPLSLFDKEIYISKMQRQAYLYFVLNSGKPIQYNQSLLPKDIPKAQVIKVNPFKQIFEVDNTIDIPESESPKLVLPKRRYWTASYETSLQFSQNHISDNWYKGGNSNFNMRFWNKFRHNYEKNKLKVSASVEYKLALYTTPTDTLRSYRIGEDAFVIIGSSGYKAFNHWFYSLSYDFSTQFFNNYYENKMTKSSAFLSPMTLNVGVGMEYKLSKKFSNKYKKLELSTNISPLSYNMKYLMDEDVDKNRHGFKPNEDFIKNWGSKLITTLQFNFNRNVSWNSRFYYFSNFEKVESEFENTLNMAMSRYFSTMIYLIVRYDDGVKKKEPSDSYFQYYEILSFGFNYKF